MRPRRASRVLLAAALVLLPLVGCERDHIEIAIEPGPDGSFVRTIRLWHSDTEKKGQTLPATAALVEQAKAQYPKALETHDGTAAFQATFRMVPADLGRGNEMNRGGYTVWPSRLGYVGYYRERRPGRTDHYTRFREMADAVDLFVKLVSTIARQQLKGEKGLEQLAEFIEGPFHRDVKEAVFFVAHVDLTSAAQFDDRESERTLVSATAFIFQFAEERRYIEAGDIPRLLTKDGALGVATALVAAKMGRPLDAALRKRLAALAEPQVAQAAYLAALLELKLTEKQFEDGIRPLREDLLHMRPFASEPELRYSLTLSPQAEVRFTNGKHDPKTNTIRWTDEMDDRPVASVYFALWSAPDSEWQTARFGRVVLRGKELTDYVFWESSLGKDHAAAWQAVLARLDPKGDVSQQLAAIRLDPAAKQPGPEEGAQILIEALKPKQANAPKGKE